MKNISKLIKWSRTVRGKIYDREYLYVPAEVRKHPLFFKTGDIVAIELDNENNRWYLSKVEKKVVNPVKPKIECKQKEQTTMIEKKKSTPKKSQNNQTQMIICPECKGKNVLVSKTSTGRKCAHCGFNIKKENYEYFNEKKAGR